jgi:hypothetical protein
MIRDKVIKNGIYFVDEINEVMLMKCYYVGDLPPRS